MRTLVAMIVSVGVFATGCASTNAREDQEMRLVAIPQTEVMDIHSLSAETDYQLWVATPRAAMAPVAAGPQGVLYVLDANLIFGTAVEMTRVMRELYGELPPLLVVGIAYGTDSASLQTEMRTRDFTPTADSGFGAMALPDPALPEGHRLGRAPQFLEFLTREVKPLIERKYDVAKQPTTIFGSSLGGLFALYALVEHPEAFDTFVAVSPALWWGNRMLLKREQELSSARVDLKANVFLAVGADEERADVPALAAFRMVSNVREFQLQLSGRQFPSLTVASLVAEGETHTTVIPVALTRALRALYPPSKPAWMR
jgi:predicted alpha/beta superfamily hydrolase